ncbi:MAG: DUF6247 family protein [Streptosporangiales bacterium]
MTAQPIEPDPLGEDDPAVIHARLPEQYRAQFLREYRAAAQATLGDLGAYRELTRLLRLWRLRTAMYSRPGFTDRAAAAGTPRPDDVPIEELVPDWESRLHQHDR